MLGNPGWHATDRLMRAQLNMVRALGDLIALTGEDYRRVLDLTAQAWEGWTAYLSDGPLPAEPPLPDMLRRLGEVAFRLSLLAEGDERV